jgi:hypothetical protein
MNATKPNATTCPETIRFEGGWPDAPQCVCGNTVIDSGFVNVDRTGAALPEGDVSPGNLFGCCDCGRFASIEAAAGTAPEANGDILTPVLGTAPTAPAPW